MAVLRFGPFTGEVPRLIPRLLPEAAAQYAFDSRLDDGSLTPLRKPLSVFSAPDMPADAPATIYLFGDQWLYWSGLVHATPGPVAADRLYYTGDGAPKMRVGSDVFSLAINAPTLALTASLSGAATDPSIDTQIYTYTNVSELGEESEPAPVSNEVNWQPGKIVSLSGFSTTMGDRTATKQRIYRSQTSTSGMTMFFLIAERNASTSGFTDNLSPTAIQEALPSLDWNPPPAGMRGLIPLPNGMMAAFDGKRVLFCEPYHPHAWPEKYILTTEYEVVGLGAYGTTLVIMTKGNPYVAAGISPGSMSMEKLELNLPCINPAGIVDMGYAIAYPTHDGLVVAQQGGARVATESLLTRDNWLTLNPYTIIGGQYDGRYTASYSYIDSVTGQQLVGTILLDLSGDQPFVIRSSIHAQAFFYDLQSGALFFLSNGRIYEFNAVGALANTQGYKSKEHVLPKPVNMGAIYIEADGLLSAADVAAINQAAQAAIAANAVIFTQTSIGGEMNGSALNVYEINGDDMLPIPTDQETFVTVSIYADKRLVATVTKVNDMARLPSGFLARIWEAEVTANIRVNEIRMAGTGAELVSA